jgi:hypothetical protein
MASIIFPKALSLNVCKGFTASKCKITDVYRSPYGFTAPRGYIYLPFPILIIIMIVILISPSSMQSEAVSSVTIANNSNVLNRSSKSSKVVFLFVPSKKMH